MRILTEIGGLIVTNKYNMYSEFGIKCCHVVLKIKMGILYNLVDLFVLQNSSEHG
jgi:hypothetical protein